MKRIMYFAMALLLVLTFTVGAGAQEKVKLVVAAKLNNAERIAMWQSWVDKYNKANPNVEVELVHGGNNYYDNQMAWIVGGKAADIMWMGSDIWRFADVLMPLNRLYETDPVVHEILPNLIQAYSWKGNLMCLPYGVNTHVMYYNKDILNKQGINMPSKWTWDDAIKMGQKATLDTDGDGVVDQWGMYIYDAEWAITYGGNVYSTDMRRTVIDNPATIAGLQTVMDIYTGRNPVGFTQATVYGGAANAINGKIAMGHIGPWEVPSVRKGASFDWDVTVFPTLEVSGKKYNTSVYTIESWTAYSGTKHPVEAQAFLSYLLSQQNMSEFAAMGTVVPSQPRIATQAFMAIKKPQHITAFAETLNYWKQNPADHPAFSELKWWSSGTWSKMENGEISVAAGIPELARQINASLDGWFSKNTK